jgi:ABC-2 type transport system permease protein
MGDAWAIAAKDLRRRFRDRTAVLVAFVLPFGLAWIFSLTLGDVETRGLDVTYGVVNLDPPGAVTHGLTDALDGLDFATIETVASADEAERLAENGDLDAAVVIPTGFSSAVTSGQATTLRVLGAPDSTIGSLVLASIVRSFAEQLHATTLSIELAGGVADPAVIERAQAVPQAATVRLVASADQTSSQSTFFAIGMAVFFLFFAVEFGIRGLLEERELGTLGRLLVAPIRPASVIGGKGLASLSVGLVSTVLLVVATTWLLGAEWGDPLGVALLIIGGVLAAVGVTAMVATFAKTTAQAGGWVSVIAVVGGLLGGTFFPISQAGWLAQVRFLSPQGWLMEGFQELAAQGGVPDIVGPVIGVYVIALVTGAIAWARANRMVSS